MRHPLNGIVCHHRDGTLGPGRTRTKRSSTRVVPVIRGSFRPPHATLQLGIGRQPNGFTCGTETFLGICDFLRLPIREPDWDDIESFDHLLRTNYQTGTDPEDIADIARQHLGIEATVRNKLPVEELVAISNHAQHYVERLNGGAEPDRALEIAMVTYQAYVDPAHQRSRYIPPNKKPIKDLPVRSRDGSVLWRNDWSDGHWSAVLRVVTHNDAELQHIHAQLAPDKRRDEVRDGVVILGDPSNGEGLSFLPIPEFEARWHDTDKKGTARFTQTAVILSVPARKLKRMKTVARQLGVPMFSLTARNTVIYVP